MSIVYCVKTHSLVLNDNVNKYYSPPELDRVLGQAEKYFVQARASNVTGTTPKLDVVLESSADGLTWTPVSSGAIKAANLTVGGTTNLFGSELAVTSVQGTMMRAYALLSGTGPNAYIEVWICGRTAV